jgi:WD40 repeat protein
VERRADRELYDALARGEFCYVLTPRQMGKSSLMVRTAARLRQDGWAVAVLDLTAIGQNLTAEQWYDGLLNRLGGQFDLQEALDDFWGAHSRLGPLQRFMAAVRTVLLPRLLRSSASGEPPGEPPRGLVIFVDEIDIVRSLPFSTDEFFAAIRECYNNRAEEPNLTRLTFCLLGVATPSDLIRDTRLTPFNIGRRIDLEDFSAEEAGGLACGLGGNAGPGGDRVGRGLLRRIRYWTGGHPYLTQRLCREVARTAARTAQEVDRICREVFLSPEGSARDDNLIFVRDRLLRSEIGAVELLELYRRVLLAERTRGLAGGWVRDDPSAPAAAALRLTGVTRSRKGLLRVRNRLYASVFNHRWVLQQMPDAEVRRQEAAFRRGVLRASLAATLLLVLVGGLAGAAIHETAVARQARADAMRGLETANRQAARLQELAMSLGTALRAKDSALSDKNAALGAREVALRHAHAAQKAALAHAGLARAAQGREREERLRVQGAEQEATRRLWGSYLAQARAGRWSGRPGRRFESLQALASAALIRPTLQLRNEAISCLTLADLQVARTWRVPAHGPLSPEFDPSLEHYAAALEKGGVSIRRVADGREIARLPGPGAPVEWVLQFSPSGRYLAVEHQDRERAFLRVWDVRHRRMILQVPSVSRRAADFSPDSERLAVGGRDGAITVYELASRKMVKRFDTIVQNPFELRFDPGGGRLAVSSLEEREVRVVGIEDGSVVALPHPTGVRSLTWHPDGIRLATACADNAVYVWDTVRRSPVGAPLHHRQVVRVAYAPSGLVLATYGWDGVTRLWDPATGNELVSAAGQLRRFSRTGDRLAFALSSHTAGVWKVALGDEYRTLAGAERLHGPGLSVELSPDAALATIPDESGAAIWHVATGGLLGRIGSGVIRSASFHPSGRLLITSGAQGVEFWPLQRAGLELRVGLPERVKSSTETYFASLSADGRLLAVPVRASGQTLLIDVERRAVLKEFGGHPSVEYAAISPHGEWVATGTWHGSGIRVWDSRTGRLLRELAIPTSARPQFSPDGKWLVTSTGEDYSIWETRSWRLHRRIHRENTEDLPGPSSFTRDGKILAIGASSSSVRLLEPASGRELATLDFAQPLTAIGLAVAPDGSWLVNSEGRALNLARIRRELAPLGLAWSEPQSPLPLRGASLLHLTLPNLSASPS